MSETFKKSQMSEFFDVSAGCNRFQVYDELFLSARGCGCFLLFFFESCLSEHLLCDINEYLSYIDIAGFEIIILLYIYILILVRKFILYLVHILKLEFLLLKTRNWRNKNGNIGEVVGGGGWEPK